MDTKKCLKCGFSWIPRKENPVACPNCKNRKWSHITQEGDLNERRDRNQSVVKD